jgi:sugar-specific transcriptional regulator TrmB
MRKETKDILKLLEKAGFSDKESAMYIALLTLGRGTVSDITREASIGRTYGYPILDSFVSKGLAQISGKEPKKEYYSLSPRTLITYIENQIAEQKDIVSQIRETLPTLTVMHNVEDRPKIRFYEGVEGLKEVYEDTLTSQEKSIRGFAKYEELHNTLPNYFPDYYKRRAEKGIFGRGIATDTPLARARKGNDKKEARDLVLVPKDIFDISPEFDIYDNKVMVASWREKLGIIIESGEIADAMKKIFELAWIGAKSLEKK